MAAAPTRDAYASSGKTHKALQNAVLASVACLLGVKRGDAALVLDDVDMASSRAVCCCVLHLNASIAL